MKMTQKPGRAIDEKVQEVARKVEILFQFAADLIKDKEMLKKVMELSAEKESNVLTLAPILGAYGENYEDAQIAARIKRERSKALYDLIDTLSRTAREQAEYDMKKKGRQEALDQIHRAIGL